MDDVWCSLDMPADIAGLQSALADPFWQPFTDSAVSSIGTASAYFGVDDVDLMISTDEVEGMANMDATGFFGGGDGRFVLPSSTSSSLSSKRSLSLDSGGSSGSITLDHAAVLASRQQEQPPRVAHQPFDHDDEAIMRAMMAVMSSSSPSPSSSASSRAQPFSRDSSMQQQAAAMSPQLRGGHVMVKSSLSMSPDSGSRGQQPEDPRAASGQLYHMMSERKRREKLNDSFQALRSLLPPCSKKDKTTVLTKAAGYLKTLEAQVSELEEKNSKLEKAHPGVRGGGRRQAAAESAEGQGADQQVGVGRGGEPDGDGDGGVRRGGAGAPHPGVPPVDGAGPRALRRRRHLLPAGAAQGHRKHQVPGRGRRLERGIVPRGDDEGS